MQVERESKKVKARCFLCSSRCGAGVQIKNGRVVKVEGDPEDPVSKGWMCSAGKAAVARALIAGLYRYERFLHGGS